jgi:hypothetical protein
MMLKKSGAIIESPNFIYDGTKKLVCKIKDIGYAKILEN